MGGDNSFIFAENTPEQVLTVDLGRSVDLCRVGTSHSSDRWLCYLEISTSLKSDGPHISWGIYHADMRSCGTKYFDRPATSARFIKFVCKSGHYYGAGARLGPVFAWGDNGAWSQHRNPTFPVTAQAARALVHQTMIQTGKSVGSLSPDLWDIIFSFTRRSDWPQKSRAAEEYLSLIQKLADLDVTA